MKKVFLTIIILILIQTICFGIKIKDIQIYNYERSTKIVILTDKTPRFSTVKGNDFFRLKMFGSKYSKPMEAITNPFFKEIYIKKEYNSTDIVAKYKYLTSAKVVALKNLNKLVITFTRISNSPLKITEVPEITSVTKRSLKDRFKLSISLNGKIDYEVKRSGSNLLVTLKKANSVIKSRKIKTNDTLVKKVGIDQAGKSVVISLALAYPAYYKVYKTEAPYKLIVEVDKKSKSTISKKEIVPGLTYMKVVKGAKTGATYANVLLVDPSSIEVFPYLPKTDQGGGGNIFQAIFSIFAPSNEDKSLYSKARVSEMVKKADALGGINGTFYGRKTGEPLGILMVSKELISYSIHDRTALIIDKDSKCYIDNISLSGGISINGSTLKLTGINEKRKTGDVIIYTPRFGKQTKDETPGLNLSIEDRTIKHISIKNSWIPKNGYVVSADPTYYEKLKHTVKVGDKVNLNLRLSTFSEFDMPEIKHIVGGGPRLVKGGQLYISKNIEKFKHDIAKSRAARTAVGIRKDGKLLLVTVDKNKQIYYPKTVSSSAGMTLEELAVFMGELGAVEAMNLDGGSSTTFILENKLINNPASGEEVQIGNALLVRSKTISEEK